MDILSTNALSKYFRTTAACDNISINIRAGEIYGFLGLNGAGKTTLIRMLLGMIKPDRGTVSLFGKVLTPRFDQWNNIGYLVETPYSYPDLSVCDNLKVYYKLRQLQDPQLIDDVIHKLKLNGYRNKKAKVLSLGNQQRLGLAKALMHKPRLLVLDEPINGLDPEGIVEVRELLQELSRQGSTIFLSSHILGEIARVANRIGIIHAGKVVKELTTHDLQNELIKKTVVITSNNAAALDALQSCNYKAVLTVKNEIEISDSDAIRNPENISRLLVEKNLPPQQLYSFSEDLEQYFLRTIRNTQ